MADVPKEAGQPDLQMDVRRQKSLDALIASVKHASVIKIPSAATMHGMKSVLKSAPTAGDAVRIFRALPMVVRQRRVQGVPTAPAKTALVN